MYKYDVVLEGAKLNRKGELDRRFRKQNRGYIKKLEEYRRFKESWEDEKGEAIADLIADDIKRSLENGVIPLSNIHTEATRRKRMKAGYDPDLVFYAMGDLIDHIQLYVKIRS